MLIFRSKWEGLTKPQQDFLRGADRNTPPHPDAVRWGWSGMGAVGSSVRVAARLEQLGYVEYVDHGIMEDEERERPLYAITDKGRDVLRFADEEERT